MVKHTQTQEAEADAPPTPPEEKVGGPEQLAVSLSPDPNLGGLRQGDRFIKGMGFKVLGLRVSPADYTATGVKLTTILPQIGWKNIYGLVGLSWATAPTGTPQTWTLKPFLIVWDAINQTLRAYKGSAGALAEIAGADIAANDLVRVIVVGG
jgi:hypothetical protein